MGGEVLVGEDRVRWTSMRESGAGQDSTGIIAKSVSASPTVGVRK
ncbi:hypothetical protein QMK32_01610 [Rhodococcus sp. H29-C3]|nr:hypothetical protein [Rhodococcus sp. H29-C3]